MAHANHDLSENDKERILRMADADGVVMESVEFESDTLGGSGVSSNHGYFTVVGITVQYEGATVTFVDGTLSRMVKKACGCPVCNNTGYRGRIAVHEIMTIDKEVRWLITENVQVEVLKDYLLKTQGMKNLKQRALYYLRNGVTTVEEVAKVAYLWHRLFRSFPLLRSLTVN